VKLFREPNSKFYWYDFTVRGRHYRGSSQETKVVRASKVAGLKFAQVVEGRDPLPREPSALDEVSERFLHGSPIWKLVFMIFANGHGLDMISRQMFTLFLFSAQP
jgi:hypothetical protein